MNLLPYTNLKFKTSLSKEEILVRLNVIIEPVKKVRILLSTAQKPYEGEVNEDDFSMMLLTKYARSMAPVKGKIKQDVDGHIVMAKVQLHIIGVILLILGLLVPLLFIIFEFVKPILNGKAASINYSVELTVLLGLFGLYLVFYFVQMLPFWKLQSRIKKDLCMLLKTEEVEDLGFRGERRKEYE